MQSKHGWSKSNLNFDTDLFTSRMNKKRVGLTKQCVICLQVFVAADKLCCKLYPILAHC